MVREVLRSVPAVVQEVLGSVPAGVQEVLSSVLAVVQEVLDSAPTIELYEPLLKKKEKSCS